ncbi:MAG: histidinol-phosphate transaminase [Dehalococcoidia bacterium]|nr:histidinol-phosphate transaminase [Dehalococcoidia bacterium]
MRKHDLRALIRPDLLELPGYVPIEPTDVLAARAGIAPADVLKLDGNENPFGPSPKALTALAAYRAYHIYPDPDQRALRDALAAYLHVDDERIVCGLGSDDLIDLVLRAVIAPGDAVIDCPPTFGMYLFSAQVAGARVLEAPRQASFALDVPRIEKLASDAKAIFIASPNNPTGNLLPPGQLERLLDTGLLVVVDEAYIEFAGTQHSALPLLSEHENLVVLRTFSKWAGLAGLRAGYGIMSPALAAVLMTIKQPYNLNVAAGVAARAALDDAPLLAERACRIAGTRNALAGLLEAIDWITAYPSDANFILCRLEDVDALEVKERLAKRGIFVRYFDAPALRNHLRISVGLPEHNEPLVRALREIGRELRGE